MLRELGVPQPSQADERIEQSLAELLERGWLVEDGQLSVTQTGREHLRRQMRDKKRGHGLMKRNLSVL
jgi:hypothetical protein